MVSSAFVACQDSSTHSDPVGAVVSQVFRHCNHIQVIYKVCVDLPREFERDKYIEAGVVKGALAPSVAGAHRSVISEVAWQPLTHQLHIRQGGCIRGLAHQLASLHSLVYFPIIP